MDVIELTKTLIEKKSITPEDAGCQELIGKLLKQAGFTIEPLPSKDVSNFYAWHGSGAPLFIFSGHTDVVPPGLMNAWDTDPFIPTEKNGMLYGRGAADMKSAIAAIVVSAIKFVTENPQHFGTVALAITSDEEGAATDGSIKIVDYLKQKNTKPNYVLVGEPSSEKQLGDTLKIGRRGSLHGHLKILGKQGHIAYPDKSDNAIHRSFTALNALTSIQWDKPSANFPATALQFYDIQSGVGASNVIPGELTAKFNIRFSPNHTPESLQEKITATLNCSGIRYEIMYRLSGLPFFSDKCELSDACQSAIEKICQRSPCLSTAGGTSDGRFFASICKQIVELGVVNQTIHKVNECTDLKELAQLAEIYQSVLAALLT